MDEIEVTIKKILPSLEESNLNALLVCLSDLGVSNPSDLSFVDEIDLKGVLKTIQARKLIASWKKTNQEDESNNRNQTTLPQEVQQECKKKDSENPPQNLHNLDWAYEYEVPWKNMPSALVKALEENKTLSPSVRRNMVRIVTDDIQKITQKPGRKALAIIARMIVKKYSSLSDTLCGEIVGEGHLSLAKQMEVRFDNLNRTSQLNVLKRSLKDESENVKKIKVADAYGCINWQPPHLPVHENEESQEKKREAMISMPSGLVLDAKQKELLAETYCTQRREINRKTTIVTMKLRWPLLFSKEGLLQHFKMLTEVDFSAKMSASLSQKGDRIFNFLKSLPCSKKNKKKMQEALDCIHSDDADFVTILKLLSIYFDEDVDQLLIEVDVTKTDTEVEQLNLPSTPCLICYGEDAASASSFKLFVDGTAAIEAIRNITDGFALMFASYYCFNIHYPKSASTTLEFVQRCLLGINPNRGSKKNPDVKKQEVINSKILNLVNKMAEFELIDH